MSTIEGTNGQLVAIVPNPAVSENLLQEISKMQGQGVCMDDVIQRLRPRNRSSGVHFSNWKAGISCKHDYHLVFC